MQKRKKKKKSMKHEFSYLWPSDGRSNECRKLVESDLTEGSICGGVITIWKIDHNAFQIIFSFGNTVEILFILYWFICICLYDILFFIFFWGGCLLFHNDWVWSSETDRQHYWLFIIFISPIKTKIVLNWRFHLELYWRCSHWNLLRLN